MGTRKEHGEDNHETIVDEVAKVVQQAINEHGVIFNDNFRVIFHETSTPSRQELDFMESLRELGWKAISFARKYDGVTFEPSPMMAREKHKYDLRIFSPEFRSWIMARCSEAGRGSAQFCTILYQKNP